LTRRRLVLRTLGLAGGALALGRAAPAPAAAAPSDVDRARLMARAVELRRIAVERGDQAFGAVVARDGQIVGEGISAVLTTPDPTAHGEVQAIRDAARRLGSPRLTGCELYTTFRPCPMCEAAAYWAGIVRIVHGETMTDAGAPRLRC
jgi:tRNA(Arg) A34 adenosine deaminase TadA